MSIRRFYTQIEGDEAIQQIYFVLNLYPVEEEEDCIICMEAISLHATTPGKENVICHVCEKPFHISCIETWFRTNNLRKCAHCRTNWKFEIDIIELPKTIVELDDYSVIPTYRRVNNRITVRGSIAGDITSLFETSTETMFVQQNILNRNRNNPNVYERYLDNFS
jgi:hypothetical protein